MPISSLFSLLSPLFMEDISHYIVPLNYLPPTLVHHLSHHLSICPIKLLLQLFLSYDLPGNTVQRSTPHKCGHKSRYSAFNVVIAAFLQIFQRLPSSLYVREAFLRDRNFVENYYSGPNKQLNRVQYIRGEISSQKASWLFPTPKILVGKSQQFLTSHSFLLRNSGSRIRPRIQYLSIWILASPRPSTHEFWTFAPTNLIVVFNFRSTMVGTLFQFGNIHQSLMLTYLYMFTFINIMLLLSNLYSRKY